MRVTATCRRIPRRHSTCRSRPGRPVGLAPSRPTASSNHLDISIKSANAKCPSRKSSIKCHYLYLHTWSNHLEASAPIGAWMCNFLQAGKINQNILARLSCPFFWKLWQKDQSWKPNKDIVRTYISGDICPHNVRTMSAQHLLRETYILREMLCGHSADIARTYISRDICPHYILLRFSALVKWLGLLSIH